MQENYINYKIRAGEGEVFGCLKLFGEPVPAKNFYSKSFSEGGF